MIDLETRSFLSNSVRCAYGIADPLLVATVDAPSLVRFAQQLGWELTVASPATLTVAVAAVSELQQTLAQIAAAPEDLGIDTVEAVVGRIEALVQAGATAALEDLADALRGELLPTPPSDEELATVVAALVEDITTDLIVSFLAREFPAVLDLGLLLHLITIDQAPAIVVAGVTLRRAATRHRITLGLLVDVAAHALDLFLPEEGETASVLAAIDGLIARADREVTQATTALRQLAGAAITLDVDGVAVTGPALVAPPQALTIPLSELGLSTGGSVALTLQATPSTENDPVRYAVRWTRSQAASRPTTELGDTQLTLTDGTADTPAGLTLREQDGVWTITIAGGVEAVLGGGSATLTAGGLLTVVSDGSRATFALRGELAHDDLQVALDLHVDGTGFEVSSTGAVDFGHGIRLRPVEDDRPVLRFRSSGDGQLIFDVAGRFGVPHADEPSAIREVSVQGELVAEVQPDGSWAITGLQASMTAALDWTLPGGVRLTGAMVELRRLDGAVAARLGGTVAIGQGSVAVALGLAFDDVDDPTRIRIDSLTTIDSLVIADELVLIAGSLHLEVATHDAAGVAAPWGRIALEGATAGLFPNDAVDPADATLEQMTLAVVDLRAALAFDAAGVELRATAGALRLPMVFGPDPDDPQAAPPTIALTDDSPLTIVVTTSAVSFGGSFTFTDVGLRLGVDGGTGSPGVTGGSDGGHTLMIRVATATLAFSADTPPTLTDAAGAVRLPLPGLGDVEVAFTDVTFDLTGMPTGMITLAEDLPELPLGGGVGFTLLGGDTNGADPTTGLTVTRDAGVPTFRLDAAGRLHVPVDLLTEQDGDAIAFEAAASLTITAGVAMPKLTVGTLAVSGTFRLGGPGGLQIVDGALSVTGMEHLFAPSPSAPVTIAVSGDVVLPNGPRGGLDNARLIFEGDPLPRFDLDGVSAGTGELQIVQYLPARVTQLRLQFDPDVPLPQKLRPQHITAVLDAEVEIAEVLSGSVGKLTISFDANGTPSVGVDTLMLEVSALELADGFALGGGLALGGLTQIPDALVLAGKLTGKVSGAGVEALAAFGIVDGMFAPLGASLEASLGPAGIPLGPSGVLLTGVSGGVSMTGGNADPDDLRAYVSIDDSGAVTSQPRPVATNDPLVPATDQVTTAPAEPPPADEALAFACPSEPCPPPSVGILYQPHPDSQHYPNRIIVKFTSLDRAAVDQLLAVAGIDPSALEQLTPEAVATRLGDAAVSMLSAALPFAADDLEPLRAGFANVLQGAVSLGLQGGGSVYDAVVTAAYKGVPAYNSTLKLTGTLSYAGVSAFLSITGGFVYSPTVQSVGVLGSINLVGIPVGRLRGFLTVNNAAGMVDPALCGDLHLALGPLELGTLRMTARTGFDLASFATEVLALSAALGDDLLGDVLHVVDAALFELHDRDPAAVLAVLEPQQVLAFVATLMQQPPRTDLRAFLVALFDRLWTSFDPELLICGSAQPKLFGMALDGELVGVSANVRKDVLAASFRFSPSGLLSKVLYNIVPAFDRMTLSLRLGLPDPRPLVEAGFGADLNDPQRLADIAQDALEAALRAAVATITYDIAPMGFRLAGAAARMIMPDLLHHPAHPASSWQRPEDRPGQLLSRLDVLLAAVAADKLGDVFWEGTAAQLRTLPGLAGTDSMGELSLREGYFPHGGILGAGQLELPELFIDAPPALAIDQLLTGDLSTKLQGAQAIIARLTTTRVVGQLGFYVPAPNPPMAAFTASSSPAELATWMQDHPFDLDAAFDAATRTIGGALDGIEVVEPYPLAQSFLRGWIGSADEPARLLGIPVGHAQVSLVPPDDGAEGSLLALATVPSGSWLSELIGAASLRCTIRQVPPRPVAEYAASVAAALAAPNADVQSIVTRLAADLVAELPKVAIAAVIEELRLPGVLQGVLTLQGSAELHAYSPCTDDPAGLGKDADPVAAARARGGVVLMLADVAFRAGPFHGTLPEAQLAVLGPGGGGSGISSVSASLQLGRVSVPGLSLDSAVLALASDPPVARLDAAVAHLDIGVLRIVPRTAGDVLRISVDAVKGTLTIDPAGLEVPGLGGRAQVLLHGKRATDPFTFDANGPWSAGVSLEGGVIVNPFDPRGAPLLTLPRQARAHLEGDGLRSVTLVVDLDTGPAMQVLPGVPLRAGGACRLRLSSDGSVHYEGAHALTLPGLEAMGALSLAVSPPTQRGPGAATLRLAGASVRLVGLVDTTADLAITPAGITASLDLGNTRLGLAGLVEARAGQWQLAYVAATGALRLRAQQGIQLWLLGRSVATIDTLEVGFDPDAGTFRLDVTSHAWVPILPGLLELQPAQLRLVLAGADSSLAFTGAMRALQVGTTWRTTTELFVDIPPGPFTLTLLAKHQVAFLPAEGPVHRRATAQRPSRLDLARTAGGAFSLTLADVGIAMFGTRQLTATIATDGRARFGWTGTWQNGGLRYEPAGELALAIALRSLVPTLTLTLPAGTLRSSMPGWPSAGIPFPTQTLQLSVPPSTSGTHAAGTVPWRPVPGVPVAEYRVTTPTFAVTLDGEALQAQLKGALAIRSAASRPDGQRWAQMSVALNVAINASGTLVLPMPPWPALGDPLAGLRSACKASAPAVPPAPVPPVAPSPPSGSRPTAQLIAAWATYDTQLTYHNTLAMPGYHAALNAYNTAKAALDAAIRLCPGGSFGASCRSIARSVNPIPSKPVRPSAPSAPSSARPTQQSIAAWAAYDVQVAQYQVALSAHQAAVAARQLANTVRQQHLTTCDLAHPQPPSLPSLPPLTLSLGALFD